MKKCETGLDPYPGSVEIGYGLTKIRKRFADNDGEYSLRGTIDAIEAIRSDIVNDARDREVRANEHDFSQALQILWNALHAQIQYQAGASTDYARVNAAAESIGYAHLLLADLMRSYGYRDITLDDFLEFGSGGGR